MEITHNNHYVPVWYQKRFMKGGKTSYFLLDKKTNFISIPNKGCKKTEELSEKGARSFFFEEDLYTTSSIFSGKQNDEIEKYLFGKIDIDGKKALQALVAEDWMSKLHERYGSIFEYMDAQILRTPRGINWLKKISNAKSQNELMMFMQYIRQIHCTTWLETAKDLVSAEKSEIKFIVSDNPITLYNPKYHPHKGWHEQGHGMDIPIFHKGTRTIFPIDINHCLILTNPEYTQNPSVRIATENRTNPRLYDEIVYRTDDIDRKKFLTKEEVLAVNYLLKLNAERYIASSEKEWLFPEKYVKPSWISFNKLLLPKYPKFKGDLFTFGKDGKMSYTQDSFGRKPASASEWAEKEKEAMRINKNIEEALKKERGRKRNWFYRLFKKVYN